MDFENTQNFLKLKSLFQKYAKQYGFDWRLIAALAYQESGMNNKKRNKSGAVGIMQVLPSTGKDKNIRISNVHLLENNIHAGVKYLRFIRSRYFENEPMDARNKMLFSFASYNAGAGKVARLRKHARQKGLDPNVWFRNVELIAAEKIGRETVQYVSNIYKYYIAYRLIVDKLDQKEKARSK